MQSRENWIIENKERTYTDNRKCLREGKRLFDGQQQQQRKKYVKVMKLL